MINGDLISRSALYIHLNEWSRKLHAGVYHNDAIIMDVLTSLYEHVSDMPTIDAEPVRHGRCALCRIKETGHGIIAFYKAGWQVCITKRDEGYFMVIGHEGDQVDIPVDYCPNCGAKMDGDKDATD